MLREAFERLRISPKFVAQADHEALIYSMVAAGVGVGILRDGLARVGQMRGQLMTMNDFCIDAKLVLIYSRERGADPAIAALVELLRFAWLDLPESLP